MMRLKSQPQIQSEWWRRRRRQIQVKSGGRRRRVGFVPVTPLVAAECLAGGEHPQTNAALVIHMNMMLLIIISSGKATLDILVTSPVASQSLVWSKHLLATRALEPCPLLLLLAANAHTRRLIFLLFNRRLPFWVRKQEQTSGNLVVFLGHLFGLSCEIGGRVNPSPLTLRVASHVPKQSLPGPELLPALGAGAGDLRGAWNIGFLGLQHNVVVVVHVDYGALLSWVTYTSTMRRGGRRSSSKYACVGRIRIHG